MAMDIDNNDVKLWILLGNEIFLGPTVDAREPLAKLLQDFAKDNLGPANIFANVPSINECKFYKFDRPILATGFPKLVADTCLATRSTWVEVSVLDKIESLVDEHKFLCSDYVCLVIELPQGQVTNELQRSHGVLFSHLQIILTDIKSWSLEDVQYNLKGGVFLDHGETRIPIIKQVELSLGERRPRPAHPHRINLPVRRPRLTNSEKEEEALFELASSIEHFDRYFSTAMNAQPHTAEVIRECAAFYGQHVSREDVWGVSKDPLSAFKGSYLSNHFFMPPFSSDSPTKFKQEMQWKFPIFLRTHEEQSVWAKYNPKSDFGVFLARFLCPLMLCEVVSKPAEDDRWRMLLQATAIARVGYYLEKSHMRNRPFFITAVYLTRELTASRYIVMQTNEEGQVSIAETQYDLLQAERRVDFLKEMFNLKARMKEMASNLDDAKKDSLTAVNAAAGNLPSLTAHQKTKTTTQRTPTLHSVPTDYGAGTSFAQDSEIVARLDAMGYEIDFVLFGYKHVAMISHKSNRLDRRFIKLTDSAREVEVLEYLARIVSPDNHTITDVHVWTRSSGGYAIHTPSGGSHLTALLRPNEYVWSAATQLVEGVAFMHRHGVAHRDIKPSNVLIPPDGGRLSIIDYSIATFVKAPESKSHSVVGTEGYMAPEVRSGNAYDPIRADLWSCGKTLKVLCCLCQPSTRITFIMDISKELMNVDPTQRPTMLEVLNRMAAFDSLKSVVSTYVVSGTPPSVLASYLQPDGVQPEEMLFGQQGALHTGSMALKVKESAANERPAISRPAKDAREILKEVVANGEESLVLGLS